MRRKKKTNLYAEEKRWVCDFDFKEKSEDECLRERERQTDRQTDRETERERESNALCHVLKMTAAESNPNTELSSTTAVLLKSQRCG